MKYALKAISESDDIYVYRNHMRIGANPSLELHRAIYTFWEWRRLEAAARKRLRELQEKRCCEFVGEAGDKRQETEKRLDSLQKRVTDFSVELIRATDKAHVHSELLNAANRERDEIVKRLETLEEAQKPKRGRPAKRTTKK